MEEKGCWNCWKLDDCDVEEEICGLWEKEPMEGALRSENN